MINQLFYYTEQKEKSVVSQKTMNILQNSFSYFTFNNGASSISGILVSATCIGNDGKSCPLYHCSLGPRLFSQINEWGSSALTFQTLLLGCNNLTWTQHVYLPKENQSLCTPCKDPETIMKTLSKTRYFSRSVKSLKFHGSSLGKESKLRDAIAEFFVNCCQLVEKFEVVEGIDDFGLEIVAKLSGLRKLDISLCSKVTNQGIKSISSMPNLRVLDISTIFGITGGALLHVSNLPSLEELDIGSLATFCEDHFKTLQNLHKLRVLRAKHCSRLSDGCLDQIANITSLVELDISFCDNLTRNGFAHLVRLPILQILNVSLCDGVTDNVLSILSNFPQLRSLDVSACHFITKNGIAHLANARTLQHLIMKSCNNIDHTVLPTLSQFSFLKTLNFIGCKMNHDRAVAELRASQSFPQETEIVMPPPVVYNVRGGRGMMNTSSRGGGYFGRS
jgi:hypothetical protein